MSWRTVKLSVRGYLFMERLWRRVLTSSTSSSVRFAPLGMYSLQTAWYMSVLIPPGATALTVIFLSPKSAEVISIDIQPDGWCGRNVGVRGDELGKFGCLVRTTQVTRHRHPACSCIRHSAVVDTGGERTGHNLGTSDTEKYRTHQSPCSARTSQWFPWSQSKRRA